MSRTSHPSLLLTIKRLLLAEEVHFLEAVEGLVEVVRTMLQEEEHKEEGVVGPIKVAAAPSAVGGGVGEIGKRITALVNPLSSFLLNGQY
jgi:hypothetical protein